ncbi:hypothetical protein D3C87_1700930 [compost metagenome]
MGEASFDRTSEEGGTALPHRGRDATGTGAAAGGEIWARHQRNHRRPRLCLGGLYQLREMLRQRRLAVSHAGRLRASCRNLPDGAGRGRNDLQRDHRFPGSRQHDRARCRRLSRRSCGRDGGRQGKDRDRIAHADYRHPSSRPGIGHQDGRVCRKARACAGHRLQPGG